MFVSTRRDVAAAKSAVAVDGNHVWVGANLRLNVRIDLADIAAVAHVLTTSADGNDIVGRTDAIAGASAQGCVETPLVLAERARTPQAVLLSPVVLAKSAR